MCEMGPRQNIWITLKRNCQISRSDIAVRLESREQLLHPLFRRISRSEHAGLARKQPHWAVIDANHARNATFAESHNKSTPRGRVARIVRRSTTELHFFYRTP